MSKFPENIDPDKYQRLSEKLSMEPTDYKFLEFIRKHMRYILTEENMKREDPPNDEQ
jgi:hypothetical protein